MTSEVIDDVIAGGDAFPTTSVVKEPFVAITYVITFNVAAPKRGDFLSLLNGLLDAMRHEAMFHEAVLHQDPENTNRFMLYETWEDHDDVLKVQLQRPYRKTWHEALPELLVGEREIAIWRPVRTDYRPR